ANLGLVRGRDLLLARVDRRRQPRTRILAASPPSQLVAREVHRDPDKPRSPGAIEYARWSLDRANERLLNQVVRVGCGPRHPIAESPEEAPVIAEEIRSARR